MVKHLLVIILALLTTQSLLRQFAEFSADSTNMKLAESEGDFNWAMEMKWKVNGQELRFGSLPVKIQPNPNSTDTLTLICRSPMLPNIYEMTFREIEVCDDPTSCKEGICLYGTKGDYIHSILGYYTLSAKLKVLCMLLTDEPVIITYYVNTDAITIR